MSSCFSKAYQIGAAGGFRDRKTSVDVSKFDSYRRRQEDTWTARSRVFLDRHDTPAESVAHDSPQNAAIPLWIASRMSSGSKHCELYPAAQPDARVKGARQYILKYYLLHSGNSLRWRLNLREMCDVFTGYWQFSSGLGGITASTYLTLNS